MTAFLSVVIPALNEADNIAAAGESAWAAGADEVIVVDGGSTDDTIARARQAQTVVISSARGRASQQNAGAGLATGEILLFLHADNRLVPGLREQLKRLADSGRLVCGALQQQIAADGRSYRLLERGNALRVRLFGLPYGDQAIFVRRAVFQQIGGFANLPLMEDVDLMLRLRLKHWPALLDGPVIVNPRRWQQAGLVQQTLRNWSLLARYLLGVSPEKLAAEYQPHAVAGVVSSGTASAARSE